MLYCLSNDLMYLVIFSLLVVIFHLISGLAKANEEKFKKIKNAYSQLREEPVKLLRTVSLDINC